VEVHLATARVRVRGNCRSTGNDPAAVDVCNRLAYSAVWLAADNPVRQSTEAAAPKLLQAEFLKHRKRCNTHEPVLTQFRSLIVGPVLRTGLLVSRRSSGHISLVKSTPTTDGCVFTTPQQIDLVFSGTSLYFAPPLGAERHKGGGAAEKVEHIDVELINDGRRCALALHIPFE